MIRRYYGTDTPLSTGPHPDPLADHIADVRKKVAAILRAWAAQQETDDAD